MKPKPAKRPIARRMWADPEDLQRSEHFLNLHKSQDHSSDRMATVPVIVLRADKAALEEIKNKLDMAINNAGDWSYDRKPTVEAITGSVLSSLGLKLRKARK